MNSPIVLLTDFGKADWYVSTMKGVIRSFGHDGDLIDLTHDVKDQGVEEGAFVLWNAYKYFPEGTVFLCVIDPGVGSEREVVIYKTSKHFFVAPDNNLLDYVMNEEEGELTVVDLDELKNRVGWERSYTFHGRDVFAPVASMIACKKEVAGVTRTLEKSGVSQFLEYQNQTKLVLKCLYIDKFYNIITNIKLSSSYNISIKLKDKLITAVNAYYEVEEGEFCVLRGSSGLLEVSVNQGAASELLKIEVGDDLEIEFLQ